jgi:hypothetical protein
LGATGIENVNDTFVRAGTTADFRIPLASPFTSPDMIVTATDPEPEPEA